MSEHDRPQPARTAAEVRRGRWPGWIWAVPIAALIVVAWLGIRAISNGGEDITIVFSDAHGIKPQNTDVEYRGMKIGSVSGIALTDKGDAVKVTASIEGSATKFLTTGTQFWLQGAQPSLSNLSSLGAVLSGPTIVMAPGPGKPATNFRGLVHRPIPGAQSHGQNYIVYFNGAVGSLKKGDGVDLRGFTVGEIADVGFRYDAKAGAISTPVTITLYPQPLHIGDIANPDSAAALRTAIAGLVQKGLRARLERDPPLIGGYGVSLDMVPGAPAATQTQSGGIPEIPVAPGGGLDSIVSRLNKVPIDRIAQNLLDITKHADEIVSSPQLKDSVVQLDAALKQIHQTTAQAGPKISQLVTTLRNTAQQLDQAAKAADKSLGGPSSQAGVQQTLQEIKEAARSVRELSDYLDRHPEALIKGRPGD